MSHRPGSTVMPSVEIDLGAGRHRERADLADGGDAFAVDEDDAVLDRAARRSRRSSVPPTRALTFRG